MTDDPNCVIGIRGGALGFQPNEAGSTPASRSNGALADVVIALV
jgi:hypothetical protein